jgi:hypothetical protein
MAKSDVFLTEFFKQCQEKMRQTSDLEFRLLWFLLLFFPVVGVMVYSLYNLPLASGAYFGISITIAVFLLVIAGFMTIKICYLHKTYNEIGQYTKKVWRYFELSTSGAYLGDSYIVPKEIVDKSPLKGMGAGKGYRQTLLIIWTLTLTMSGVTLILGILKLIA